MPPSDPPRAGRRGRRTAPGRYAAWGTRLLPAQPLGPGAAESAIEADFGAPIATLFASFDPTPFGAASIAQVHHAVLPTGEHVVVKVRRPGIAATIAADIEVLQQLARLIERAVPVRCGQMTAGPRESLPRRTSGVTPEV